MTDDEKPPEPTLDEKTQAVLDEAKRELDATQADFESRLAALEVRASAAKAQREQIQRQEERKVASNRESSSGLAFGLSIAYAITGVPVGCFLIGLLIEQLGGGSGWKNGLTLLGAFLGIGYAVVIMQVQNRRG